jgi:hypothetical protein
MNAIRSRPSDAICVEEACDELGLRNVEVVDDEAVERFAFVEEERLELCS